MCTTTPLAQNIPAEKLCHHFLSAQHLHESMDCVLFLVLVDVPAIAKRTWASRHSAKIVRRMGTWVKYASTETFHKWQEHPSAHMHIRKKMKLNLSVRRAEGKPIWFDD